MLASPAQIYSGGVMSNKPNFIQNLAGLAVGDAVQPIAFV
jgi:hypothetical protein